MKWLIPIACAVLAAGCGTTTGLQVANSGHTTPVSAPQPAQPRVGRLDAIAFPSAERGWAAGPGVIIATVDGGVTWTRQYHGGADIRVLEFADDTHGWAVATDSLLRTTDGGTSWASVAEPAGMVLTSVDFTGPDEGWGVALPPGSAGEPQLGAVVHTTDGGSSWSVVASRVADSVCATAGDLVAGAGSKVVQSTDGGHTWSTLLDATDPIAGWFTAAVRCPAPGSIWALFQGGGAAGSQGYAAYASSDEGVGWQPVLVSPALTGSDPRFHGVTPLDAYPGPFDAVSATTAVFLGLCPACDPQHVTALRTADGGGSWGRRVIDGFAPTGVAFADPRHGWMTTLIGGQEGRRSAILATVDGGRTWRPVFPS